MENYVVCSFSLRVACYAALQLRPGCLGLIAPDCRSWGTPARGSSWRSGINVLGLGYPFVLQGNLMASRWLDFKHSTIYIYIYIYCPTLHACAFVDAHAFMFHV